jgi:hypothetical protein
MARTPKIRVSFRNDAGYLMRLDDAIERDDKRSPAFKTQARAHINALITMFVEEDRKQSAKQSPLRTA